MANFKPLKNYLLYLLDELIDEHKLEAPFLDAGCGIGDVSHHLAQRGWRGKAVDLSVTAIEKANENLSDFKGQVAILNQDILSEKGKYKTILLCDVLEHIQDDFRVISHLSNIMEKGSKLVIAVPTFAKEWRQDDNFYGHVRRYEIDNLRELLESNNLKVLKIWDFTFPLFWFLRRIYTKFAFSDPVKFSGEDLNSLTLKSSTQSAWKGSKLFSWMEDILEKLPLWPAVFFLNSFAKNQLMGSECLFLCEKQ